MVKPNTNDKNIEFYRNIELNTFLELAKVGGFDTHKDLQVISSFLPTHVDILEIGAGYGRCIDYFIKKGHRGRLIALEKSEPLVKILKEKYKSSVEVMDGDIKTLSLKEPVDVALWMWSGIIDFSPFEQEEAIKSIYKLLTKGGRLFIDVPRIGTQTIAVHQDSQNLTLTTPYGEIQAYIPNDQDILRYKEEAGFSRFVHVDYQTSTDKLRTIYIMEK